ncbi:hypothetical protein AB0N09_31455 [Streptomyces erythrochromogenes]|uniref:hypothetical protein n=1 Tax=Streptomyces erythrochromogenes TaxID=285574 RepID=UPI0034413522
MATATDEIVIPSARAVPVAITPRPLAASELRIVTDLDALFEGAECSCSAGDDQPY